MGTVVGIIPARWASVRFEGKVLADIAGKPMIQRVWERSRNSGCLDTLIIACDDKRVFDVCDKFGANVIMTSTAHQSGTDRIAEVASQINCDIIINIQGDEPLIQTSIIDELAYTLESNETIPMATVVKYIEDEDDLSNPNIVKVVIDKDNNALYFSRASIPFNRDKTPVDKLKNYKHLGIYAYRRDFLMEFNTLPESHLEKTEKLEQLRVLEAGFKIKTIVTNVETINVDTPEDLVRVAALYN